MLRRDWLWHSSISKPPQASLPFLCTSQSHGQEWVNISKCSEEEKIGWTLRCLLASCPWHHYSSGMAMFHIYDPTAGTNLSATPQQHTQKTICLTANCLQAVLQSLAIYVLSSNTVSSFHYLFSYEDSKHFNTVTHKCVSDLSSACHISFLYELRAVKKITKIF